MKKFLIVIFIAANMTGVAHAQFMGDPSSPDQKAPTAAESAGNAMPVAAPNLTPEQYAANAQTNGAEASGGNTQTSGFVALAPIPGLTDIQYAPNGLAAFFNNLYKFLIGLAAALAVIMITWEGLRIATNQDNVSIITDSKGKIYNAIFGLVLVLSPVLVFTIINPSILNLSLNLPKLDTQSGPPATVTPTGTPTAGTISSYSEVQPGFWCYNSRRTGGFRCWSKENDCRIVAVRELGSAGEAICSLTPR